MVEGTYFCEQLFSQMNVVKNKLRNRLTQEHLMCQLRTSINSYSLRFDNIQLTANWILRQCTSYQIVTVFSLCLWQSHIDVDLYIIVTIPYGTFSRPSPFAPPPQKNFLALVKKIYAHHWVRVIWIYYVIRHASPYMYYSWMKKIFSNVATKCTIINFIFLPLVAVFLLSETFTVTLHRSDYVTDLPKTQWICLIHVLRIPLYGVWHNQQQCNLWQVYRKVNKIISKLPRDMLTA